MFGGTHKAYALLVERDAYAALLSCIRKVKLKGQKQIMTLTTKNIATVTLVIAMVLGASFAFATPAKAQSIADLQAMINSLLAQIAALQGGGSMTGGACTTFTMNHQQGDSGGEVVTEVRPQ